MKTIRIEMNDDALWCVIVFAVALFFSALLTSVNVKRWIDAEKEKTALRLGYEIRTGVDYVKSVF